jgi:hypothetical protein
MFKFEFLLKRKKKPRYLVPKLHLEFLSKDQQWHCGTITGVEELPDQINVYKLYLDGSMTLVTFSYKWHTSTPFTGARQSTSLA